jgi:hypothetical protein
MVSNKIDTKTDKVSKFSTRKVMICIVFGHGTISDKLHM